MMEGGVQDTFEPIDDAHNPKGSWAKADHKREFGETVDYPQLKSTRSGKGWESTMRRKGTQTFVTKKEQTKWKN